MHTCELHVLFFSNTFYQNFIMGQRVIKKRTALDFCKWLQFIVLPIVQMKWNVSITFKNLNFIICLIRFV